MDGLTPTQIHLGRQLAGALCEAHGIAPFAPGELVLHRRDPREAWTVTRCEQNSRGKWMVHYSIGNVIGGAPADALLLAPVGWQDAPVMPAGCVQFGLLEAARQDKIDCDAADPLYLADMRCWHRASIAWADRWLRLIACDGEADKAIAFHQGQIDAAEALRNAVRAA